MKLDASTCPAAYVSFKYQLLETVATSLYKHIAVQTASKRKQRSFSEKKETMCLSLVLCALFVYAAHCHGQNCPKHAALYVFNQLVEFVLCN